MKGRPPTPSVLREIRGTPKRKLNQREPVPVGNLEGPPDWLSPSQQDVWRYAIECAPCGLLKRLDAGVLAVWVVAADLYRMAAEKIAAHGLLVNAPNTGAPMQSPYLAIVNRQSQIMLKAGAELGFSPASRTRISAPTEPAGSDVAPWAKFVLPPPDSAA